MVSDLVSPDSKRSHSPQDTETIPCNPGLEAQRDAGAETLGNREPAQPLC